MPAIDMTDRYHRDEWMLGGVRAWLVDRAARPFRQIIIHHAGYETRLTPASSRASEETVIEAIARNHVGRLGIGPGYYYCVAPSGRLYAVGKVGTVRRHTSNINPATGKSWNYDGIAICALQNYDMVTPNVPLLEAIEEAIAEIKGWPFTRPDVRLMGHRDSGFATSCPGQHLYDWLQARIAGPPDDAARQAHRAQMRDHLRGIRQHLDALSVLVGEE